MVVECLLLFLILFCWFLLLSSNMRNALCKPTQARLARYISVFICSWTNSQINEKQNTRQKHDGVVVWSNKKEVNLVLPKCCTWHTQIYILPFVHSYIRSRYIYIAKLEIKWCTSRHFFYTILVYFSKTIRSTSPASTHLYRTLWKREAISNTFVSTPSNNILPSSPTKSFNLFLTSIRNNVTKSICSYVCN